MGLPGWEDEAKKSVIGQWSLLSHEGINWDLKDVNEELKRKEHL